jgi:hypothetical protein
LRYALPVEQEVEEDIDFTVVHPVQDVGEPIGRIDGVDFAGVRQGINDGGAFGGLMVSAEETVLFPAANGLMAFSTPLLSIWYLPSIT